MEGACLQTPNRTYVSTAMQRSGAPIIYADMCLYTQVSMRLLLTHESVLKLVCVLHSSHWAMHTVSSPINLVQGLTASVQWR